MVCSNAQCSTACVSGFGGSQSCQHQLCVLLPSMPPGLHGSGKVHSHACTAPTVATPCCPAPVSAMIRRLVMRLHNSACPSELLILWAPV